MVKAVIRVLIPNSNHNSARAYTLQLLPGPVRSPVACDAMTIGSWKCFGSPVNMTMCLGPTVVPVLLTSRRRIRALSWSLSWLIPLVTSFLLALLSTVIEHTDVKAVLEGPSEETANPASPSFLRVRFNCLEISSSLEGSDAELDYEAHRFREGALGFGRRSWWFWDSSGPVVTAPGGTAFHTGSSLLPCSTLTGPLEPPGSW